MTAEEVAILAGAFLAAAFLKGITGLAQLRLVHLETLLLSVAGILPVLLGIRLGGRLRRRLAHDTFRKAVLILMLALGFNLSLRLTA